ncbi:hypothetical protein F5B20DRAFT_260496 [Whalleya microplaca]|nr:hypothetical protein F5B20DRAFT_260496 [Whalleya microplaca]
MLLLPRFSHRDPPLSDPFLDRVGTQLGSYRPGVPASRDNAVQLLSFPNPPRPPTPGPNPRPPPIPPRPPVPTPPPSPRYTAAGPEEYVAQRLSTLISKVAANWVTLCGPVLYPPPPRPPTPGPRPGPLYPRPNQPTPPPSPRRSTRESDHDLAGAGASPEVGGIIRSLSQNCQPAIGSVPLKQTSSPNIQEPIGTAPRRILILRTISLPIHQAPSGTTRHGLLASISRPPNTMAHLLPCLTLVPTPGLHYGLLTVKLSSALQSQVHLQECRLSRSRKITNQLMSCRAYSKRQVQCPSFPKPPMSMARAQQQTKNTYFETYLRGRKGHSIVPFDHQDIGTHFVSIGAP